MKGTLLTIVFFLISGRLHAQGQPSDGKEFYLGYIYPTLNEYVPEQTVTKFLQSSVYVSSLQQNTISVSYFDPITQKEGPANTYPVSPRHTVQIALDRTKLRMNSADIGEYRACHITAQKPVTLQFFSSGANSGGSYMALPVNVWGKQYVVASYKDNGTMLGAGGETAGADKGAGLFMIIAAYDGTSVTITPSAATTGGHPGVHQGEGATGQPKPYTFSMNRGQCWMVKSSSAQTGGTDDISASIVKSDKPVAVIAGHENALTGNGNTGGYNTEGRDYMIEQMIPVEKWDNTGYITIPMSDSFNGGGLGEDVRMLISDFSIPDTIAATRAASTTYFRGFSPYTTPSEVNNVDVPVHYYADTGKFMVMQYDLRSLGTTAPYPTPSMMSIVPRSHWRSGYLWYVPTSITNLQRNYVTIIAPKDGVPLFYSPYDSILTKDWYSDSLRVSLNGGKESNMSTFGSQLKVWSTIPGHPDLRAVTYSLASGSTYYVRAPFPFMAYFFGQRAFSYDSYLSNGANDYYLSFATPLGMGQEGPTPRKLRISVDSICAAWRVCVKDSNTPGGIKSVTLLDDPNGEIVIGGRYKYHNVSFDPVEDSLNLKQIVYDPAKKDVCFTVVVDNIGQDAYAPLYIVDVNGNAKVVELRYNRPAITLVPSNALIFDTVNQASGKTERPYVHEEFCRDYLFINTKASSRTYTLLKAELPLPSKFRLVSVEPPIGTAIEPDDTVRMRVCFSGPDTTMYIDSIEFATDCFAFPLPLLGQAGTGLIVADDKHFGTILVHTQKCSDIEVRNVGNKPFTLDSNWIMSKAEEFTFDPTHDKNRLPITLLPGQTHKFWFCFSPMAEEDNGAHMFWSTDMREPFTRSIKSFTDLTGSGINPGLNWDRESVVLRSGGGGAVTQRVSLINSGTADCQITRIWIEGMDAEEFKVIRTEYNTNPPTWGGTVVPVGEEMWLDIQFDPDMSKEPMFRTRTAVVKTSATLDSTLIRGLDLTGTISFGSVGEDAKMLQVSLHPNPARDEVTVALTLEQAGEVQVHIYDMLGREVAQSLRVQCNAGMNSLDLKLPNIDNGTYVVQVIAGDKVETLSLEICR